MICKPFPSKVRPRTVDGVRNYFLHPLVYKARAYLFQSLVNHVWMLKMVIREAVELVEKVPDINTAKGIHLREG